VAEAFDRAEHQLLAIPEIGSQTEVDVFAHDSQNEPERRMIPARDLWRRFPEPLG
jgi:hypothetical protein